MEELPASERVAMLHAVEKLEALGPALLHPHQSDVRGAAGLRELRPRGGRSAWRGFYHRVGDAFVIVGVGPEAQVNRRGFNRAVAAAARRLGELEA